MPNCLILLRHAEAANTGLRLLDFERPLTRYGQNAAREAGGWLSKRKLLPDEVFCSAATRTRETWDAVAGRLTNPPQAQYLERLYHGSAEVMLDVLRDASGAVVLLVGHQPGIGQLATLLPDNFPEDPALRHFPPATALVIEFATDDWVAAAPGQGRAADYFLAGN